MTDSYRTFSEIIDDPEYVSCFEGAPVGDLLKSLGLMEWAKEREIEDLKRLKAICEKMEREK